jgi:hypothetical protein
VFDDSLRNKAKPRREVILDDLDEKLDVTKDQLEQPEKEWSSNKKLEQETKILNRFYLTILAVVTHLVVMILCLGSMWVIHWFLKVLFEEDAKFFNLIPIKWIIEMGDLLVIGKFLWGIVQDFRR